MSDFSGFASSVCALASAAASAAIDSVDRCMPALRFQQIETDRAGPRSARANAMPERLPGILGEKGLELRLGLFVPHVSHAGIAIEGRKFRPRIRGAHVNDADGIDAGPWRLDAEKSWWLAALHTPPELL